MDFRLAPLSYEEDALEPYFSRETQRLEVALSRRDFGSVEAFRKTFLDHLIH